MPRDDIPLRAGRLLEPTIRRYDKSARRRLRRMAKASPRLGDLILACPAAAYAMATGRGPVEGRAEAVRLVKAGAPLKEVAEALDLPLWSRRLPPEAFSGALGPLPDGPEIARRLPNLAPSDAARAATWLDWVSTAHAVAGDPAAIWAAAKSADLSADLWADRASGRVRSEPMLLIGAWIWHSARPDLAASRAIERGFTPLVSFGAAAAETLVWLERAVEVYARTPREPSWRGAWFKTQSVGGYRFAPRLTPEALIEEGKTMNHCVGTYAGLVQRGVSLIYAVRRGGAPAATLEIRADPSGSGRGVIAQLQGPSNAPVAPAVRRAAEQWLRRQGPCPLRAPGVVLGEIDSDRWAGLWAPMRAAAGDLGRLDALFPARPNAHALARLATVGAWLRRLAGL